MSNTYTKLLNAGYDPEFFGFNSEMYLEDCDPIAATQLAWEGYTEYDCE
jgi:hypothetical protein